MGKRKSYDSMKSKMKSVCGFCKMGVSAQVTTAWHMAMVLYASAPSPFGEFRCSHRAPAPGLNHSSGGLNHSADGLVVADDGSFWIPGLPTTANFWDWTWEPWVPCEGEQFPSGNEA